MGVMGRGKVPWPFVRRSRFVRELTEQGEAYRRNVSAAEWSENRARAALRKAEREFSETVRSLSGWNEDGASVSVESPTVPPQHFNMRVVHDVRMLRHTFVYDVSEELLRHMTNTLAPKQAGQLMFVVTEGLVAQAISKMYDEVTLRG